MKSTDQILNLVSWYLY